MLRVIFLFLLALALMAVAGAYILMLVAGSVHSEVPDLANIIKPWSFRESFFISLGLTVVGSYFKSYKSSSN